MYFILFTKNLIKYVLNCTQFMYTNKRLLQYMSSFRPNDNLHSVYIVFSRFYVSYTYEYFNYVKARNYYYYFFFLRFKRTRISAKRRSKRIEHKCVI